MRHTVSFGFRLGPSTRQYAVESGVRRACVWIWIVRRGDHRITPCPSSPKARITALLKHACGVLVAWAVSARSENAPTRDRRNAQAVLSRFFVCVWTFGLFGVCFRHQSHNAQHNRTRTSATARPTHTHTHHKTSGTRHTAHAHSRHTAIKRTRKVSRKVHSTSIYLPTSLNLPPRPGPPPSTKPSTDSPRPFPPPPEPPQRPL